MRPSEFWALDDIWVERLVERAREFDLVSFDIFDTVLTRSVDSPVDAFAEVERRLVSTHGPALCGFAQAREQAEQDARLIHQARSGAEEIDFNDIYLQLSTSYPDMPDIIEQAQREELAVETALLSSVPDTKALIKRLLEEKIPYIFVSDMYLPSSFLVEVLSKNGFSGWRQLYVSSETQLTKHSGAIWDHINSDSLKILHIGDDLWADVERPVEFGVKTVLYTRAKSERRVGAALTPKLLPFSYAQRSAELKLRAAPGQIPDQASWTAMGQVLGVLIVGAYVRWLEERLRRHKLDRVYFCARDGWLVQRAWRVAGLGAAAGIEDHYLFVARRPVNMACGFLDGHLRRLDENLLKFLSLTDNRVTIARALARAGLGEHSEIRNDAARVFGDISTEYLDKSSVGRFREFLQRHSVPVYNNTAGHYRDLVGYLKQEGVIAARKIAISDLGWHGSIQRSLQKIGRSVEPTFRVSGFYYGLWPAALTNRFSAGLMEAAFANEFASHDEQADVANGVELLEELHTAPHGTVNGYEKSAEGWRPILTPSSSEMEQYDEATRHFQDGVVKALAAIFAGDTHLGLTLDDLTIENARAAMAAVFLSPTPTELRLLGSIGHCWGYDHASHDPVLVPDMPDDPEARDHAFWSNGWRIGTLRAWQANKDRRQELREFARSKLSHLGDRVLRQFG